MANDITKLPAAATEAISMRSGLSPSTCLELLTSGWTYVEEINKPSRWQMDFVDHVVELGARP